MTVAAETAELDPITAAMAALSKWDTCLGALAEVRNTFYANSRTFWDEGVSRYLKLRYDQIVDAHFAGDAAKAARYMDMDLANFDIPETVRRAADVSDDPLMMEIVAYAMALATVHRGRTAAWLTFRAIINHLYDHQPAGVTA